MTEFFKIPEFFEMTGESRGAYACRLTFDPPQFLFEIYDHVTQLVRNPTFDPL